MKRLFVVGLVALFLCLVSLAQADPNVKALGDENLVVTGTTVYTLSPTTGAVTALIAVQSGPVRWKGYKTNPTVNNGALLYSGDYLYLESPYQLTDFKVILESGGSGATLYVIYFG